MSILKSKKFKVGSVICITLISLSLFSLFIPPSFQKIDLNRSFEKPSLSHPLGLDENGSDLFLQIIEGSKVSLTVALSVVLISLIIGIFVGTLSGISSSWLDSILMRIVDMIYAFPHFLLALALMSVLGSSVGNLILVMCLSTWASYARLIRGEILYLKQKEFVVSAESLGASIWRKIYLHIWPNLIPVLSVQTLLTLVGVILAESGLSFLGVGVPSEIPTWGSLLQSGRQVLIEAPHISIFSGLFLFLLILSLHLMSEGLRNTLSPYNKQALSNK